MAWVEVWSGFSRLLPVPPLFPPPACTISVAVQCWPGERGCAYQLDSRANRRELPACAALQERPIESPQPMCYPGRHLPTFSGGGPVVQRNRQPPAGNQDGISFHSLSPPAASVGLLDVHMPGAAPRRLRICAMKQRSKPGCATQGRHHYWAWVGHVHN